MKKAFLALSLLALLWCGPPAGAQNFQADNALSVKSVIVANNITSNSDLCAQNCKVYQIDAFNNGTALAYIKLYNVATAPTCGGRELARRMARDDTVRDDVEWWRVLAAVGQWR